MDRHPERATEPDGTGRPGSAGAPGRIRHGIWAWLTLGATLRIPIRAYFDYDRTDPCAVCVSFSLRRQSRVRWVFARDLLADGLGLPAGAGDIHIAPHCSPTDRILRITLRPPSGRALIEVAQEPVRRFLHDTERLVPRGREEIDIDAFLSQLAEET